MKSAGKARSNGLYRHIRTSKEIIRNLLNDFFNYICSSPCYITLSSNFVTNSSVENMLNNRLKL